MQICVVHQIRNSVKDVGSKSRKEFLADLKCVYAALTKDAAELALDKLEEKWGEQYPIVIKYWRDKRENLSRYFQYTAAIRRIIYTTNIVEGDYRQVRKVTKTKGGDVYFPLLRRLHSLQSIWQLSDVVGPPLLHGVIWSASICSILNSLLQRAQSPFCLS